MIMQTSCCSSFFLFSFLFLFPFFFLIFPFFHFFSILCEGVTNFEMWVVYVWHGLWYDLLVMDKILLCDIIVCPVCYIQVWCILNQVICYALSSCYVLPSCISVSIVEVVLSLTCKIDNNKVLVDPSHSVFFSFLFYFVIYNLYFPFVFIFSFLY